MQCVRARACAPLCMSKNEKEDEERWERRVKCVCVCGGEGGRWGEEWGARLNSVTSVHYN